MLYKSLIRSILAYGFPAWNGINSFNMEKIRKFERIILRACTQLYRKKDSIKYINSSEVYKKANCKRFDVFVNEGQIKFFERIEIGADDYLVEMSNCDNFDEMNNLYYKTPSYMYQLAKRNLLIEESQLLYYNKNRRGETAYVTSQ